MQTDYQEFITGPLQLQQGATLSNGRLAYKTYGLLNAAGDNVIVYPTWFGGQHTDNEWLIGPGRALDPEKYFIVVPNMFGNGLSSSPSNTPEPYNGPCFPAVTLYDNVRAQHRLLTEQLGVTRIRLVVGWSLGGMQAFQWGALYPDMVERIAPFCAAARCWPHTAVFFESVRATLTTDAAWQEGWYTVKPARGLRAVARIFASWALSQAFYREELYREKLGYSSIEDFITRFWEASFLRSDANDLLAMLWTGRHGDISANEVYNGDLKRALGAIKAKALVMPAETDLYFPVEDNRFEVAQMPNARLIPIPSIWGHFAGGRGVNPDDVQFIDDRLKELLAA